MKKKETNSKKEKVKVVIVKKKTLNFFPSLTQDMFIMNNGEQQKQQIFS
jgi:hypothetical protein